MQTFLRLTLRYDSVDDTIVGGERRQAVIRCDQIADVVDANAQYLGTGKGARVTLTQRTDTLGVDGGSVIRSRRVVETVEDFSTVLSMMENAGACFVGKPG